MIHGYLFINTSYASKVLMSKKLVGLSKINIFAFVENNTANDNFVLSPPLKLLQERSSASFKPKLFKIALLKDSDESVSSIKYCNNDSFIKYTHRVLNNKQWTTLNSA